MDETKTNMIPETIEHSTQVNDSRVLDPQLDDKQDAINRNKPWRVVIRRIIADGGNNYEDIYGEQTDNKSV